MMAVLSKNHTYVYTFNRCCIYMYIYVAECVTDEFNNLEELRTVNKIPARFKVSKENGKINYTEW